MPQTTEKRKKLWSQLFISASAMLFFFSSSSLCRRMSLTDVTIDKLETGASAILRNRLGERHVE